MIKYSVFKNENPECPDSVNLGKNDNANSRLVARNFGFWRFRSPALRNLGARLKDSGADSGGPLAIIRNQNRVLDDDGGFPV